MDDTVSRRMAIEALYDWEMRYDWDEHCREEDPKPAYIISPSDVIEKLPSAHSEYTEHEESILTMLFGIAKSIIDLQGGYMGMTDGRSFDNNDLFHLAEKLGISY